MNNEPLFRPKTLATASALALVLTACGGGGGGGTASTPSTPAPAPTENGGSDGGTTEVPERRLSGSITGFGSVFVGGVKFETDDARIIIDGEPASERDLAVGMVVLLDGTVNDDGITGTASRIVYDDELTGPIESITPTNDGDALLLVILGFNVIVERTGTVFDDITFDTLAVGDLVEVSGFPQEGNRLRATRIERKDDFVPGSSTVELKGIARNVTAGSFTIGEVTVDTSSALLDEDDGALADGVRVEVYGTLADGVLTATEVDTEDGPAGGLAEGDAVSVEGTVSAYVDDSNFRVRGIPVDAGSAIRSPADLTLGSGTVLQVSGTWDGERLSADRIRGRRGRIELEGPVSDVDTENGIIDITFAAGGTVSVAVDQGTRLDDDRDDLDRLTLGDIVAGDFLEIEAYVEGDRLIATVIDREETDDEVVQAPVEAFTAGSDITLLGVTFSVAVGETEYENLQDQDIPAEAFFAQLQPGDLIKLQDDELANGIADEIEFEDKGRLDGEREFGCGFDDDGTSCDDDDLIGDDTITDDDGIDTTEDEADLTDGDGIDTPDDGDDLTDGDGIDTPDDKDDLTDGDGVDTPDDEDDLTDGDGVDTPDDEDDVTE
ncbi:DUF5666 domain-containing protein [Pseudohaliea rubra]|uniref:DUF5666 domain-containing protein n=1 Tax=Pseudohaliea rubra DSM 19751 TaxID=1265313 RepID=A0A095VR70_9GAMM|nr:DUF5666 domain-containing protein [Pseudohaliea rubra]KGE03880.1 hypothetical protein HRUBRA_01536 [Pseudohaliea rubra DSM 19751]